MQTRAIFVVRRGTTRTVTGWVQLVSRLVPSLTSMTRGDRAETW
jgi:hypothetical protein